MQKVLFFIVAIFFTNSTLRAEHGDQAPQTSPKSSAERRATMRFDKNYVYHPPNIRVYSVSPTFLCGKSSDLKIRSSRLEIFKWSTVDFTREVYEFPLPLALKLAKEVTASIEKELQNLDTRGERRVNDTTIFGAWARKLPYFALTWGKEYLPSLSDPEIFFEKLRLGNGEEGLPDPSDPNKISYINFVDFIGTYWFPRLRREGLLTLQSDLWPHRPGQQGPGQ